MGDIERAILSAKHSSATSNWYTPSRLLDMARAVLGPIDFDPASCSEANRQVMAACYLTEQDDGLVVEWSGGSLFCNPPGSTGKMPGSKRKESLARLFWQKLMRHRERPDFLHGIFLAYNSELLQVSQGREEPSLASFPVCAPASRIRFVDINGKTGGSPSHSSLLAYVPGARDETALFASVFSAIGAIVVPYAQRVAAQVPADDLAAHLYTTVDRAGDGLPWNSILPSQQQEYRRLAEEAFAWARVQTGGTQ